MSYKESDIKFEAGRFSVVHMRKENAYYVLVNIGVCSVTDGAWSDKSVAIARAKYLARIESTGRVLNYQMPKPEIIEND